MLLKAAEDYNIDLNQSWMVGDGKNDILAGKNAGCRTAYLSDSNTDKNEYGQDLTVSSLLDFVQKACL